MALLTKAWWRLLAVVAALASVSGLASCDDAQEPVEYEVKAAFLYNFAKFVQWPSDAAGASASLRLCILGRDPFGSLLEKALTGRTVGEKPIEIGRAAEARQLSTCQVVFISSSERTQAAAIVATLSARPILTVSEIPGFAALGGMVNFYIEDRRIRFEINPKAAARSGLRISSQLLKLARVVDAKPQGNAQ
ncbi:MAG TPA: YfiR family protein [Bryobacteraceae bacterium]|nr:YfiR family protein [Bryobacteraceae bacterium]